MKGDSGFINICGPHVSEPSEAYECMEAMWSMGGSCRKCDHDCYRRGYTKAQSLADNARLVQLKRAGLPFSKPDDAK